MGCQKITYHERESLGENWKIFVDGLEKSASGSKICKDYYAGGSLLPGRNSNSNEYRYGWNKGSEKDDEITGVTGSHITTYFREYDTRLNRTWSIDPVFQPWQSPYSSMDNNPILYNDPLGDRVRIKGKDTRKTIRAAKKNLPGFKARLKTLRKKDELIVLRQVKGAGNGLVSAVRESNLSTNSNGKLLKGISANFSVTSTDPFGGDIGNISKVNPLGPPSIDSPNSNSDINRQQRAGVPPLPPQPQRINVNINFQRQTNVITSAPVGQLQRIVQRLINNPGQNLTIQPNVFGPGAGVNLNTTAVLNGNQVTVGQLMDARARAIATQLNGMGVPMNQINPGRGNILPNRSGLQTTFSIR